MPTFPERPCPTPPTLTHLYGPSHRPISTFYCPSRSFQGKLFVDDSHSLTAVPRCPHRARHRVSCTNLGLTRGKGGLHFRLSSGAEVKCHGGEDWRGRIRAGAGSGPQRCGLFRLRCLGGTSAEVTLSRGEFTHSLGFAAVSKPLIPTAASAAQVFFLDDRPE